MFTIFMVQLFIFTTTKGTFPKITFSISGKRLLYPALRVMDKLFWLFAGVTCSSRRRMFGVGARHLSIVFCVLCLKKSESGDWFTESNASHGEPNQKIIYTHSCDNYWIKSQILIACIYIDFHFQIGNVFYLYNFIIVLYWTLI